jgi:glutaconyl-CoA/methylmalonyl-CoA decarboxylase subunit gamma
MKLRITVEGKLYDVDVEVVEGDDPAAVAARSRMASAPVVPLVPPPLPIAPPAAAVSGKASLAPIAGTVSKVLVNPGDRVKQNDVVLILEAMKMESNVVAPVDGLVKSVNVTNGYRVVQGQVLVEFD